MKPETRPKTIEETIIENNGDTAEKEKDLEATAKRRGEAVVEAISISDSDDSESSTPENLPAPGMSAEKAPESGTESLPNPEGPSKEEAQRFIRRYGRLLSLFSKDSSLQFELDENINTFAFDADSFRVHVPLEWFSSGEYSEHELLFSNYHERAHFIDMRKNPEAYLGCFERMDKKATALAKDYLSAHPGKASLSGVKKFYYDELHTLYNCLDDIYVNDMVKSRVPLFSDGDGADDIVTLYDKLNFGDPDLTDHPLHRQLAYSLLRDAMVGKERGTSIVDERVEEVLSKKRLGKTIRGLVETELKTRSGVLVDPAERYRLIQTLIEPLYLKLLEEALNEKEQEQQQQQDGEGQDGEKQGQNGQGKGGEGQDQNSQGEGGEGAGGDNQDGEKQGGASKNSRSKSGNGMGGNKEFDPFGDNDKNSPSKRFKESLDKGEDADKITKEILDALADKDKEDKMSPQERAKHQAEKRKKAFDKKNGITQQQRETCDKISQEITAPRREMREFWKSIIGKSLSFKPVRVGEQRRGRLNVPSFIRRYPEVIEAERDGALRSLNVYERTVLEHELVDKPDRIEVTLLVDCSGSMGGEKEEIARKTAALLMYSLKDFNDELEKTRRQTHSTLKTDSQVVVFGSTFEEVKHFNSGRNDSQSEAEIIKSLSQINNSLVSTNDAAPLTDLESKITSEQKKRIEDKRLKKIIFVITDGASDDENASRDAVLRLAEDGVIMVGFQIGSVNADAKAQFDRTWQANGNRKSVLKGIRIESNVAQLPSRLMEELHDILGDITI